MGRTRLWQSRRVRCVMLLHLLFLFSQVFAENAFAAKKGETINSAPDSNIAGLINTEVVPETAFQADLITGNVWYGITEKTNVFVNVFALSRTLLAKPLLAVGGKARYCETVRISCSLTAMAAPGIELTGDKKRVLGLFVQNSLALDYETSGRITLGLGAAIYSERGFAVSAYGYSDRIASWLNFLYDLPVSPEWSFGVGFSPTLKTLDHEFLDDNLLVTRLGMGGAGFFHIRAQTSVQDWHFSGGGGLLSAAGSWSLWPMLEVVWRIPEGLFASEETFHEE